MSNSSNTNTKVKKTEIYKKGNTVVSSYPFTISDGDRKGEVLELIEIMTIKKKWSDEIKAFYERKSFVTLTKEDFIDMLKNLSK